VDVLHLSSKWEITVMRAAAIAAISPLLSSMDELVFGRLYDVELWVLDALVGILGRKEDLSIEEARRMQLEDVVAIAKGRRDAQMLGGTSTLDHDVLIQLVAALYPQEFGHLLQVVTNSSPPPSMPAGEQLLAEASVEDTGAAPDPDAIPSQERMADLRRWIGFVADPTATEHYVSRACLIKYTDKHPAQRPTIFDLLMQQGLQRFKQSEGKYFAKNLNAVVQAFDFLKLKCKWEEGLFEELVQAAALRLVDHWDILTSESLTETPAAVSLSSIVLPIFDATRFVRHLVDKKVVPIAIFCMFWAKLLVLFETSIQQTPSQCPHVVRAVLEKTEGHVFTNAACLEIDTFYEMVDSAQARIRTQWAVTADLLQVSLAVGLCDDLLTWTLSEQDHQGAQVADGLLRLILACHCLGETHRGMCFPCVLIICGS
jgi:hypothetical protein